MPPDIKSRFGTAIRSRRKDLGLSQEELAGRAGLHRTYVADIERGARNLSLANIEKLATALELSIPILFSQDALAPGAKPETLPEIVLVEDEPGDIELTLRAFRKARVRNPVRVLRDGAEALDFLLCAGAYSQRKFNPPPQVVLLDLNLPRVQGLEVLRRLKSDPQTRPIPVVVLSVSERNRDIEESRRLGAETYIVKPVNFVSFSAVTPQLKLCWTLEKHPEEEAPAIPFQARA
ncbi:MAG TPA: response regulator [Verrucomicrobiae bacterium]|nr:response regulator [Verrucomicrobiae bacterium]